MGPRRPAAGHPEIAAPLCYSHSAVKIFAAVLAAGRGERMRVATPKPLFPLLGRPMIAWTIEALRRAGVPAPIVITSPALKATLRQVLGPAIPLVIQPTPLGTGDAVSRVKPFVRGPGVLVVINADSPLFEPAHVRALIAARAAARATVSFATAIVEDPTGLGRVLRDPGGQVGNIIEESEAGNEVRAVREINAGLYAFAAPAIFDLLDAVPTSGPRRERYLTKAVALALARGLGVETVRVPAEAAGGVNTLAEASVAQSILQARTLAALMASGVMVDDPASVTVEPQVRVAPNTRLLPGTSLTGTTTVGPGCLLGPGAIIRDAVLGAGVSVRASFITGARIEDRAAIGPFAHVRPGSRVRKGAAVGTAAEVNRSDLGEGAAMHHFGYLGDAVVGAATNIGAGAVTANYDGRKKHATRIGRAAFIGSNSTLVAPARVGDRARVGAGAVVPGGRAVAPGSTVVGVPARRITRKGGTKRAQ